MNTLNEESKNYYTKQLKENGKLKFFSKIKMNFEMEIYLIEIQNVKHRQAVTKLRISAQRLPVETGRYKNIPYCDRVCRHCDLNEVGDEQHYVMSCRNTMFATLRQDFIDDLYKIMQSFFHIFFKLEYLLWLCMIQAL